MFKLFKQFSLKNLYIFFCILTIFQVHVVAQNIDKSKYITVDEISSGMKGHCKTVYKGVEIEEFAIEVVDVVRDIQPGKDAILVMGTDERFVHTGPVSGCSGSPVYIDGRLAGALAFGWNFSKDALYGVRPIEEMLRVGTDKGADAYSSGPEVTFDLSKPIDFKQFYKKLSSLRPLGTAVPAGASILPCPLATSLPGSVCEELKGFFEPFGLVPLAGATSNDRLSEYKDIELAPGSILAVPVVSGDISFSAVGTVTEVVGDKVYGFGHSFLGYGSVDLPMATGYVHTVVAHLVDSFKFAQAIEVKGALTTDESVAILGQIGKKAKMIPMRISVDRHNDKPRTYNCQVITNRVLTPFVVMLAVNGAAFMVGDPPPEYMVEYKVKIGINNFESVRFENISYERNFRGMDDDIRLSLSDVIFESIGSLAVLMNNPYRQVEITSLDFDIKIIPTAAVSRIWSVDVSDKTVAAGEEVNVSVVLESYLSEKRRYECNIKIPDDLAPGKYQLAVNGVFDYESFLRKAVPYRFTPENLPDMINILNDITNTQRDKLYFVLLLPPSGIAIERAELADLPKSKEVLLTDNKRSLVIGPVAKWLEKNISVGTIVVDKKITEITLEKK